MAEVPKKYGHITRDERVIIYHLLKQNEKPAEIARQLGRTASTIGREIKRNRVRKGPGIGEYFPNIADSSAVKRRSSVRLLDSDNTLRAEVYRRLKLSQSPEQISNVLLDNNGKRKVSDETIYRFIFADENQPLKLWQYLRWRKVSKRKQHGKRVKKRSKIPGRISIHERHEAANKREEFGHWEGDLVVFKRPNPMCFLVLRERLSRTVLAQVCPNRTAPVITNAVLTALQGLPVDALKTLTLDNDLSFVEHTDWQKTFAMKTYFCDPYSSWQKGAVEQANLWLREMFPRNIEIETLGQQNLDHWVELINARPTKCLDYQTPERVFMQHIQALE